MFGAIEYPLGQQAIKDSEPAVVNHVVSDFDVIAYSSPNGQLDITSDSMYEPSKTVSRVSGGYNVSSPNFSIAATRTANGAISVASVTVFIAHSPPSINLNFVGNPTRLRSGGNDGTSPQNYTLVLSSSQQLLGAPSLVAPEGTFISGFTGGPSTWTRQLQVHDNDPKGAFNFGNLVAVGLAGVEQTALSSGSTYVLGGFVARTVPLAPFATEATFNVSVSDYTKTVLSWSFKSSLVNRQPIDTVGPVVDGWCLIAPIDTTPVTVRVLDFAATSSSSSTTTLVIEEVI